MTLDDDVKEELFSIFGVNYIDKLEYQVYKNLDEFLEKNKGDYYFFTRYKRNSIYIIIAFISIIIYFRFMRAIFCFGYIFFYSWS